MLSTVPLTSISSPGFKVKNREGFASPSFRSSNFQFPNAHLARRKFPDHNFFPSQPVASARELFAQIFARGERRIAVWEDGVEGPPQREAQMLGESRRFAPAHRFERKNI